MATTIKRFSDYDAEARQVLSRAARVAELERRASLDTGSLLRGLLDVWPAMSAAFAEGGVDAAAISALEADDAAAPTGAGLTDAATAVLPAAETEALLQGRRVVTRMDLLVGLLTVPSPVAALMRDAGLTPESIRRLPG